MQTKTGLHPQNKHRNGYDFEKLIQVVPELKEFIFQNKHGKTTVDFSDSKAVKALNIALLKMEYAIDFWEFPDTNLCPPIPGRVDYIHHLADIIGKKEEVRVLDIGTGASCIYPILGTAEYGWSFVGTDIDKRSLQAAHKIINKNGFDTQISLRLQKDTTHILQGIVKKDERFTITMCNPPFYASMTEAKTVNSKKTKNLGISNERNFSGNTNELTYKGGEKAFLHTYLYESSLFPKSSQWFTSLVSKKENVKSLANSAKKLKVKNFKEIRMEQGNKITRIVVWQF